MPIIWWRKKRKVKNLQKRFDDAMRLVRSGDDGDLYIGAKIANDTARELHDLGYCPDGEKCKHGVK